MTQDERREQELRESYAEPWRKDSAVFRSLLIEAAATFIRRARDAPGVLRIALLGSLTTSKAWPKDVDALVAVEDDAELSELARLARRLSGRLQSLNSGADVFLANPRGEYIGRLCLWRECAPGIRRACDALNCGRRHYLHDDLRTITLPPALVQAPPVDVRPSLVRRVDLPADLNAILPDRDGEA